MSKNKVDESIIQLNQVLTELRTQDVKQRKLSNQRAERELAYEQADDLSNGVVPFNGPVNQQSAYQVSAMLRSLARLRPGKPIRIELNSPGGQLNYGFQLIDDISVIGKDCPITIAVRGQASSMAGVLLQAAKHRLVGPYAYVMLHRASFGVEGSADGVEDAIEEVRMFENRMYEIVAKRTGKTVDFWKKQLGRRKNVWYSAGEAVKIGLADAVG